jgi:hypothetical protein
MPIVNSVNQQLTQYNIPIGAAGNLLTSLAPSSTSGETIISQGASSDPIYGTSVVAGGGTGGTSFTAYSVIVAGTTSTGALQNVSGVGTLGQGLISNDAGALPTWQNQTGGSTIFNVADITLTNSQLKNLTTTPITLVAAQGAGTIIVPVSMFTRLNYGGNNIFTGAATFRFALGTGLTTATAFFNIGGLDLSASTYYFPTVDTFNSGTGNVNTNCENQPLVVYNSGTALTGNAANDNTYTIYVLYYVVTF